MSADGDSLKVMKIMFPDSIIESDMILQRNKLSYLIVYGILQIFSSRALGWHTQWFI